MTPITPASGHQPDRPKGALGDGGMSEDEPLMCLSCGDWPALPDSLCCARCCPEPAPEPDTTRLAAIEARPSGRGARCTPASSPATRSP